MQVFYAPDFNGKIYTLDRNESKHTIRALRMKKGDRVNLIDGKGNLIIGIISDPDPEACTIEIISITENFERRDYRLHLAVSPLKNVDRFEWFIEKAVEIGVDTITPLICTNTEKPGIREERIRSIIVSAMKQSLKAFDTKLQPATDFKKFISESHKEKLLMAHCLPGFNRKRICEVCSSGEDILIIIGPEGDFTKEEAEEAMINNYTHITLGGSRLRTETAGIAACHSIYFMNHCRNLHSH